MKKNLKEFNILIIVGLFLLLFNPPLISFANSQHIVGIFSIIYCLLNYRMFISYFSLNKNVKLIFSFIFLFFYLLVICLGNSVSYDESLYPLMFLIDVIPFCFMFLIYKKKHGLHFDDCIKYLIYASLIESFTCLLAFFIPSVQRYFIDLLVDYGYGTVVADLSWVRMYGFSGGLTFETPAILSIISIFTLFFYKNKYLFTKYLISISLLFAAIINARVSIVIFLLGILVFIFYSKIKFGKKMVLIGSLIIFLILIVEIVFPIIKINAPETYKWLVSGIEEIFLYLNGNVEDTYFEYVSSITKYEVPISTIQLLFGTGLGTIFTQNHGIQSDIGFINDIWIGGIIFMITNSLFWLSLCNNLRKSKDSTISFIGTFLIIALLALNFKGIVFHKSSITILICIIYIYLFSKEEKGTLKWRR